MSKRYERDAARYKLIDTGFADYLINLIESDIHEMFDSKDFTTESQRERTNYRIGQWFVYDDITVSEKGFSVDLTIEEAVTKRWFKVGYIFDKWYVEGGYDLTEIIQNFSETCRKHRPFTAPDPDTKIYKSIYSQIESVKEDKRDYSVSSIHPAHREGWSRYNTKESMSLIKESGFNMALMCLLMYSYDSGLNTKTWNFRNDQLGVLVYQSSIYVAILFSHPETDEDGITCDEPDLVMNIFKQDNDIQMTNYLDDPKNYLVSVRSILEDAKVVDPEQFAYFVKLFKEV